MEDFERYKTFDDVQYDITVAEQATSMQTIQTYFANNVVCTRHDVNGNYREYKASSLSSAPTHPVRADFGYENLKTGSIYYDITNATVYMFDEFSDSWKEQ